MPHRSDARILIIDDDAITRQMLLRSLKKVGYELSESESGLEAWELIQQKPPALLLLDYAMPDLDGAELIRRIRSHANPEIAQIPAIMLTGHGGEESEVLCLQAGASDFVTKPINLAVLQARIDTQLRLRYLRLQLQNQNAELEHWRANLERDLAAAQLTQQSLIPQKPLTLDGWDVAACFRPVIEVGGDIYGWLPMSDGRMLFWIADATGHGAAAALLTTLTTLLFHHGTAQHDAPATIMQAVNNDFRSIFGARSFMTAMCLALNPETGTATMVGAGHPPLLVCRAGGGTELVSSTAPPLGLIELPHFVETTVELGGEDAFILYTDGLFGGGANNVRLTPDKLAALADPSAPTADALLRRLIGQVSPGDGRAPLPDDLAAIAARRMREKKFFFR